MPKPSNIERYRALRQSVLAAQPNKGAFLQTDSAVAAEIASRAGYDWLLVDLEHGHADQDRLLGLLQAIDCGDAIPIARIAFNDLARVKRTLDMGVAGIMFPSVHSAEEAKQAVQAMRFPTAGLRGVASSTRASNYGLSFQENFSTASHSLLTIIQIESRAGVEAVDAICQVEGVDVIFIGPVDLSAGLGVAMQFDHPDFVAARQKVIDAAKARGKILGTLCFDGPQAQQAAQDGFTFISLGSDVAALRNGLSATATALQQAFEAAQ